MSDKVENIEIKRSITKHKIYCDNCNKFLSEFNENDDGYFDNPFEVDMSYYIGRVYYIFKKDLCNECYEKLIQNIIISLENLGFESEFKNFKEE